MTTYKFLKALTIGEESFASFNIVLAASTKVLFFLSTTPFCCGVLGAEYCRKIPLSVQNSLRIAEFCTIV